MRIFGAFLRKEWLDQRGLVAGLGAFLLLAAVILGAVLSRDLVRGPLFASVGGLAGLGLAAAFLGSDLIPGEKRRGRLEFLTRLPGGLGTIFLAKTTLLLAVLLGFSLFGYLAGGAASALLAGGAWLPGLDVRIVQLWPVAPAIALWAFTVSFWLPRGTLALPAAFVLLAVFFLPAWLIGRLALGYTPGVRAVESFYYLLGAGALPVAWLSFRRGRLPGVLRGLAATFVLFLPAWGYAAQQVYDWNHFDPREEPVLITAAYLGKGERFLFLDATEPGGSNHPLRLDLATGAWAAIGRPGDWLMARMDGARAGAILVVDAEQERHKERRDRYWCRWFDPRTGEPVKSLWWRRLASPMRKRFDLADGTRIFVRDGRAIVRRSPGGATEEVLFPR